VLAFIIWNLILLTSVLTVTELIEEVEPMLNWTLIAPAFKVSITVLWVFLYTVTERAQAVIIYSEVDIIKLCT